MAVQQSKVLKGIQCDNAYHIVSDVRYGKLGNGVRFTLLSYYNADARTSNVNNWLEERTVTFTPSGSYDVAGDSNISTACYTYLKTLDQWSGSVDV